jgi:hypothetical protein
MQHSAVEIDPGENRSPPPNNSGTNCCQTEPKAAQRRLTMPKELEMQLDKKRELRQ